MNRQTNDYITNLNFWPFSFQTRVMYSFPPSSNFPPYLQSGPETVQKSRNLNPRKTIRHIVCGQNAYQHHLYQYISPPSLEAQKSLQIFKEFKGFLERQTQTETLGMKIASFFLLFLWDEEKHQRLTTSHFHPSNMLRVSSPEKVNMLTPATFSKVKNVQEWFVLGSPHSKRIVTQLDLQHTKDHKIKFIALTLPEIVFLEDKGRSYTMYTYFQRQN